MKESEKPGSASVVVFDRYQRKNWPTHCKAGLTIYRGRTGSVTGAH